MFSGLDTVDIRHGRRWTALTSFVLQGILVSAALVLPLLHPANLPEAFARHRIFVPMPLGDTRPQPSQNNAPRGGGVRRPAIIVRNPFTFPSGRNQAAAVNDRMGLPDLPIGSGPGSREGIGSLFADQYAQPVLYPAPVAKPRPISVVMEGNLIHRVEPQYPTIAKQIRLQGVVVLRAVVSSGGAIDHVHVVSGPAILAHAAIAAVNQWRYRPYYLNGLAIPVETEITVNFTLSQ